MLEAVLLLAVTVTAVVVCARVSLPAVLAYLLVGIILGPSLFNAVHDSHLISLLGEIGIAFLLFSLGLEFSWKRLWSMRAVLFGLGSLQVVVGTLSGALIAWWAGMPAAAAVIAGGALALSSTAIVIKQLSERAEIDAPHGRLAVAILLFQDIAAVPFLVAIPIVGSSTASNLLLPLFIAFGKGLLLVAVMFFLGRELLSRLFTEVARHINPELMTLTVLFVALAAATASHAAGLSSALGTFIAGMLLAESEFSRQIRHDIRPFRDVLLGLFFISVGLDLNLRGVLFDFHWILVLTLGLIVGKGLLISLLAKAFRHSWPTAFLTGASLGQGGEFGLALIVLAVDSAVIPPESAAILIAAIALSMLIAPLSYIVARRAIPTLQSKREAPKDSTHRSEISDHIIIAGYGRTGRGLADVLLEVDLPFVAIDRNPASLGQDLTHDHDRSEGLIVFGNAEQPPVLDNAGIRQARALVVTFDDHDSTREIVRTARELNPTVAILVRAQDPDALDELVALGASDGVPETLESSLALSLQTLLAIDLPYEQADLAIRTVRSTHHPLLAKLINEGS